MGAVLHQEVFSFINKFMQLSSLGISSTLNMENKNGEVIVNLQTNLKFIPDVPNNCYSKPSRLRRRNRRRKTGKSSTHSEVIEESVLSTVETVMSTDEAATSTDETLISSDDSSAAHANDIDFGDGVRDMLIELAKHDYTSDFTKLSSDSNLQSCHNETSFLNPSLSTPDFELTSQVHRPSTDVQESSPSDELNTKYLGKKEFERYMDHFIISLQKELTKPSS